MRTVYGNVWNFWHDGYHICVPTNGSVTKKGLAVMGRGVARQAVDEVLNVRVHLGSLLELHGNHVLKISLRMLSFPVKREWHEKADLKLIERSAIELMSLVRNEGYYKVYLPRPGCGNGGLDWPKVRKVIEPILSDVVYVITR